MVRRNDYDGLRRHDPLFSSEELQKELEKKLDKNYCTEEVIGIVTDNIYRKFCEEKTL
jgi:hypothetical protein